MMRLRRRAAATFVVAVWSVAVQGCYQSLPLETGVAPSAPERVELVLNDQGRAALADRLGPMVGKVDGHVVSATDDRYTIAVARIAMLNGNSATWNGEQVEVLKAYTVGYQVKKLDKVRTFGLALVVSAGAIFVFVGKSLLGGGTDDKEGISDRTEPTR